MTLLVDRLQSGSRRTNLPVVLAGLAVLGTYALARAPAQPKGQAPDRSQGSQTAAAAAAPHRNWRFWKDILYRTYRAFTEHRLLAFAASVVFYGLLALFPAITALVSSYALFAAPETIKGHLSLIGSAVPANAYPIIDEQVTRIVSRTTGTLGFSFFFGFALALWSANAGIKAVLDPLNVAYGARERRSFIKLNLISLAFTVGAIAAVLLAIAAIVVVPLVLSYLPLGGWSETLLVWARWPALLIMLLLGLALLYRFGPDREQARFRWITPGAIFAAIAWLAGSALLSWYLRSFANYDATYGSLGAAIALMMWMWMSAIVVLLGAELNAVLDSADKPKKDTAARRE